MKANTKKCSRCKKQLSIDCFNLSVKSKDGKGNYCKRCNAEYQKVAQQRSYDKNPALHLLKKSCQAAFRRSQPDYTIDGYANVRSSYQNVKEFYSDLWNDDSFRDAWAAQTNIYHISKELRDRPTLDRIDSAKGYEKSNIRMLPQWQNVLDGAQKDCQVFVIRNARFDHTIDFSSIGEAKKAIASEYGVPLNTLNCVDHGTMVHVGDGVSLLLQTRDGSLKAKEEGCYLCVIKITRSIYDQDTGVEIAKLIEQLQLEVSGIEIRPLAS